MLKDSRPVSGFYRMASQTTCEEMKNTGIEYLEDYLAAQLKRRRGTPLEWGHDWALRTQMVREYAWAIPDMNALVELGSNGPIVEMGAGSGYWAYLLQRLGVDVVAYDKSYPTDIPGGMGEISFERAWAPISIGGPEVLAQHADRALFLCWPDYNTPFAAQCLKEYQGDRLIYVGESRWGCTGDPKFFEALEEQWVSEKWISLLSWDGIHDGMEVYRRKQTPVCALSIGP